MEQLDLEVGVEALQWLQEEESDSALFPCTVTTTCDFRTL